jgi:uncharacterized protein YndB with AHSA1/START domain
MDDLHDDRDLGSLAPAGDRWSLTFTRSLGHPPDKVWRAITEDEHLSAWFPQTIVGERRAGAALRFVTSDDADEGFAGELLVFDPPHVLEMTWGDDVLRIELAPDGDGTRLTLVDTFAEHGKAARDAAGWHECLDNLVELWAAGAGPVPPATWATVHPVYVERFGPAAATIGPPD